MMILSNSKKKIKISKTMFCWGIIRDEDGGRILGCTLNIGLGTSVLAELWGVYYGLNAMLGKRIAPCYLGG